MSLDFEVSAGILGKFLLKVRLYETNTSTILSFHAYFKPIRGTRRQKPLIDIVPRVVGVLAVSQKFAIFVHSQSQSGTHFGESAL